MSLQEWRNKCAISLETGVGLQNDNVITQTHQKCTVTHTDYNMYVNRYIPENVLDRLLVKAIYIG